MGELLRKVLRRVQVSEVRLPLFEDVHWIDDPGLVKEQARAIKEEPGEGKIEDDRDVDGFAKAGARTLIVKGIEQVDELMLVEFAVASGAHLDWR